MPEKTLKKINAYILPQWKVCFLAALFLGFIAHAYKLTGWLPNWDSLVFRYDPQNMVALGRWFLPVVCSVSSFYDLPFLNGIIAIIFHGLSAVCICRIFNVEKKITAFLIGAMVVSFPTVTSVLMYNYVADGYGIAFFLSTLAAFFATKEKPKYIIAAVLIALSTGIYQAYLTVTISLILLKLVNLIVFEKEAAGVVFKKALFMLGSGIGGLLLYSLVLNVILKVCSIELLDYQGVNATASLSTINIFGSFYIIKETFFKYFFNISQGINAYVVINLFIFAFVIFYYIKCICCNKLYKKPLNLIAVIFFAALLPFGATALAFINSSVDYHNLMLMGYASFYIIFLFLYENGNEKSQRNNAIKKWIVLITALALVANQTVIANVSYHKAQMSYEKSYGVLIRIADRIEQTSGAENCEKLLVIGALDNSEAYSANLPPEITGVTDGYIIRADDEIVGQSVLCSAINDYCGKNYKFISGEEKKNLIAKDEVKAMEKWPQSGSVSVIGDTVIVKLNSEGEK